MLGSRKSGGLGQSASSIFSRTFCSNLSAHYYAQVQKVRFSTCTAVVESYSYRKHDQLDMAGPEVHHLFHHPIADHSFSADRKTLAVARDINVELYSRSGNNFTLQDELKGHDKTVTSVDIAPNCGMIVTCSQGTQQMSPSLPLVLLSDGI